MPSTFNQVAEADRREHFARFILDVDPVIQLQLSVCNVVGHDAVGTALGMGFRRLQVRQFDAFRVKQMVQAIVQMKE